MNIIEILKNNPNQSFKEIRYDKKRIQILSSVEILEDEVLFNARFEDECKHESYDDAYLINVFNNKLNNSTISLIKP